MNQPLARWAEAIAMRLGDEWLGEFEFPEDAELLKEILTHALSDVPDDCILLIGTGIIEVSYFEPLC